MIIDTNLDKMDDLLEEAWNLPFSGGKRMIDIEKMRNLIDDIRLNLPRELKEAKAIVADRESILKDAELQAEEIIKRAEGRARALVSEEEITKIAKEKATSMLSEASSKARELQQSSVNYTDNALKQGEEALLQALGVVRTARSAIRAPKKQQQ